MYIKRPERSALVDLVMKNATEEEKAEATRNWFGFLELLIEMVEKDERNKRDGTGDQSRD